MSNNNYPLDEKALEEQYADLLLKIALKEYLKEQALQMKQQEAEAAPAPQPAQKSSNVVAVAFRQVGWQEAKETVLSGLKKGVTRVAVVLLAAAITFTTAFAASDTVKESVLKKLQSFIYYHTSQFVDTIGQTTQPRFRYDDLSIIPVPNDGIQQALEIWTSFCDSGQFVGTQSLKISTLVQMFRHMCRSNGCDMLYSDTSSTWIPAEALERFAEYYFGISAEALRAKAESEQDSYDAEKGYRNIHDQGIWYAPVVKSALTECVRNADGTYTMEVYLLAADPQTGESAEYCNTPMLVTVDLSGDHPVFLSARAKDLLSK